MTPAKTDDLGAWLWPRCYACGHRLAFAASACPQCGEAFDGRRPPKTFPDRCGCARCQQARR